MIDSEEKVCSNDSMKDLYLRVRHHSKTDNIIPLYIITLLALIDIILLFY